MTMLHSRQDRIRDRTGDAYRAYLMQLKRLRVLTRKVRNRASAALEFIHQTIIAAKMRRVQRELMFHAGFHDEWSAAPPNRREGRGLEKDARDFPQTPLLLSDKWDS
jgi:hypothetical protein